MLSASFRFLLTAGAGCLLAGFSLASDNSCRSPYPTLTSKATNEAKLIAETLLRVRQDYDRSRRTWMRPFHPRDGERTVHHEDGGPSSETDEH